jgi:poly(A) polymerase
MPDPSSNDHSRTQRRAEPEPPERPESDDWEADDGEQEDDPLHIPATDIDREVLDRDARRVVLRLQRQGHEAYFVGGCVRDLLIGRVPKDFDVATSAHPQAIKRMLRNGRIIGRRFRLVHVYYGDNIVETATFRREPTPEPDRGDGKGQDDLLIVEDNEFGTAEEDARRRDFTVNGLFLDPASHTILDYVDGLRDLDDRILRTIGDARVRMAEDPVRILRAIKFATRLGFRIESQTWDAMKELAPQLARSAAPRVLEEILRLMRSGTALGAIRMLRACSALEVILPQVHEYLEGDTDQSHRERDKGRFWRLLEALDAEVHRGFTPTTAVAIAALFSPIVEREAEHRDLPAEPEAISSLTWEIMEPLANTTRLSRRDVARTRQIIANQPLFSQPPDSRFSPLLFARSEDFSEALSLFELRVEARGQGWDIVEGWRARQARAKNATADEIEVERRAIRGGKRRRRRRKRR